ncbi:response regulator [Rubrivivax gelatinosus]|uniref:response regulator n=1 Tax=Rubrivivax gelatinosus TaxID=28068 RepID=UPI003A7FD48B
MRVLYVDDDRINTLLFEETCRCAGDFEVACAGTGAEALELAAVFAAEALVIDLHLPDTNGFELLPALRQALGGRRLPAFLCTADEPAQVAERAAAAGFNGCWTKPVTVEAMLAELQRGERGPAA